MFTGIIEEIGVLKRKQPSGSVIDLEIDAEIVLPGMKIGDSIAVDGVCLTVTYLDSHGFIIQAMQETVSHTTIPQWKIGERLNLERALSAGSRLGGHLVQGHIDGLGTIQSIIAETSEKRLTISAAPEIMKYIVRKGSITIDGISLTVAEVFSSAFAVAVIPHTWQNTIISCKAAGASVNLETDIIARYIEKFLQDRSTPGLTEDFLRQSGF